MNDAPQAARQPALVRAAGSERSAAATTRATAASGTPFERARDSARPARLAENSGRWSRAVLSGRQGSAPAPPAAAAHPCLDSPRLKAGATLSDSHGSICSNADEPYAYGAPPTVAAGGPVAKQVWMTGSGIGRILTSSVGAGRILTTVSGARVAAGGAISARADVVEPRAFPDAAGIRARPIPRTSQRIAAAARRCRWWRRRALTWPRRVTR